MHFYNKKYETIIHFWKELGYESKWFRWKDKFYEQLCACDYLRDTITEWGSHIILWGTGKRGKAFERWCSKSKVTISGVYDKNIIQDRDYDEYGNKIYDLKTITRFDGLVVASNSKIYHDICSNYKNVIDLESFCPI